MCIYYKNRSDLTYKEQEHVFPAGLGGIAKLPKGCVSDQANILFSGYEAKLMRNSVIAVPRMLFGPGKRGSLNIRKVKNPNIIVGRDENKRPILHFIFQGKQYCITQALILKSGIIHVSTNQDIQAEKTDAFQDELNQLAQIDTEKCKIIRNRGIDADAVLIGIYCKSFYMALHPDAEIPSKEYIKKVLQIGLRNYDASRAHHGKNYLNSDIPGMVHPDVSRAYAKVALNVFTYCYGEAIIDLMNFGNLIEWILGGQDTENFEQYPKFIYNTTTLNKMADIIPEYAHWCSFSRTGTELFGIVCFYNQTYRIFHMGSIPADLISKVHEVSGMVCDWKLGKEIYFEQLMQHS